MIKVVFVCLGNICRSPMAQGLFSDYVHQQGLGYLFDIQSRATSTYEIGNKPHKKTIAILEQRKIKTSHMAAKQITKEDFDYFDYIIAMDSSNISNLKRMSDNKVNHKIHLLIDNFDVPDPYYTGDFKETYQLISSQMEKWLTIMMNQQSNQEGKNYGT